jgi:hypothetical protein
MATILTLTDLYHDIYAAMDTVARERVGFIPAVARDSTAARAAIGEVVRSPVVGAMAAEDLSSANVAATPPTQTINNVSMEITKSRSVPFGINGEETKGLQNAGTLGSINQQRIEQALRTLTNEIEADLSAQHIYASRAYGTATGTPFNTANDLTDFSNSLRILEENGVPSTDLHMVLGSAAVNRLRGKQSSLFSLNTGGNVAEELLRRGSITAAPVMGFDLHQSASVKTLVTAGTGASATTGTAGYAIGTTTIALAVAGTGTIIAGDIITFANDTNQYLVVTGDTDVSNGGSIVIAAPGLLKALPASAVAITVIAATTRNMAFHRSAIQLATRAPAMPEGGDDADDMMLVTDPISGITYEFIVYRQKRQIRYEVNLAWGVKTIKPEFISLLIGA